MIRKPIVALFLALAIVLLFATPVLAQTTTETNKVYSGSMGHTVSYDMDGIINFEKQAGHICNTGAEMRQAINGAGAMTKDTTIFLEAGYINVDDGNDWTTASNALSNLTVTTTIRLCAPAKHVYEDDSVVPEAKLYGAIIDGSYDPDFMIPLTDQIWAVQVSANPGFTGSLNTDFEAAHGDWEDRSGDEYRGNFFNVSQSARTTQGLLRRYIDISSPINHGFLSEDVSVTGAASVTEAFRMTNKAAGKDLVKKWWIDLF